MWFGSQMMEWMICLHWMLLMLEFLLTEANIAKDLADIILLENDLILPIWCLNLAGLLMETQWSTWKCLWLQLTSMSIVISFLQMSS